MKKLQLLQEQLGYSFKDISLLKQALTHRSFAKNNNERLEFVGDGILDCVIALNLYLKFPELAEGELSKMRAALVNQDGLVEIAEALHLGEYLLLGDGELKSGGRQRPSIVADGVEALFAAVFLDGGFECARATIEKLFADKFSREMLSIKDYKTQLQEVIQARHLSLPVYEIIETSGPEHEMVFKVECRLETLNLIAIGIGKGKKQASQDAAYKLLQLLQEKK